MSPLHVCLALCMSAIFGAGWVFGKAATDHFPPMLTAAFRFGIAGLVLVPLLGWPRAPVFQILVVALCALAIPYSLSYLGLAMLDVSTTVLLVQLEAPLLIVLSAIFLGERPSGRAIVGVCLAVLGILFVVGAPNVRGSHIAVLVVLVSMLVWAAGQLQIRRFNLSQGGLRLLGASCAMAAPLLVAFSLIFEGQHIIYITSASALEWVQVGYLGLGMTVLGQGIWFHLVARHPLNAVAPFLLLVPVFSIIGAVVFLGETPETGSLIGGCVILAGVALATLKAGQGRTSSFREKPEPPQASRLK